MDVAATVERYLSAARRGVAWLETHQHDDGSLGPPVVPADVYHKAGYALGITGRVDARFCWSTRRYSIGITFTNFETVISQFSIMRRPSAESVMRTWSSIIV